MWAITYGLSVFRELAAQFCKLVLIQQRNHLSIFAEFLGAASKTTVETTNPVVILVISDLGSATGTASA